MKNLQRMGGIAALYMAVAYIAAIPYFLVWVNYPGVVDPTEKVILLKDNYASMYAMHVIVYEFVAIGLVVLGLIPRGRGRKGLAAFTQQAAGQCKMFDPQVLGQTWARQHRTLPEP